MQCGQQGVYPNIWPLVKKELLADMAEMKMGDPRDFKNFIGAVIDEKSFDQVDRTLMR